MDVKNYAPFSVYPLSERIRVRLMMGSLFLVSYINLCAVFFETYNSDAGTL
jgi:hypothetical protein